MASVMQRTWLFCFLAILVCLPILLHAAELSLDDIRRELDTLVAAAGAAEVAVLQCDGWEIISKEVDGVAIVEHAPSRDDFDLLALQLLALDIKISLYKNLVAEKAYGGHDDLVHRSVPLTAACNMIIWWYDWPDLSVHDFKNLCTYQRRTYALAGRSEALMAELSEDFNELLARVVPRIEDRDLLVCCKDSLSTSAVIATFGVLATYKRIIGIRCQVNNELAEVSFVRGRAVSDARSALGGPAGCPSPAMSPRLCT